ncbi:MAG: Wzy polymerase domain-containing protein [Ilumatobacteraceae bacterium]|nr:Wzy polymerase domain-containing protein [Ilumatobacteraceae bacterium]
MLELTSLGLLALAWLVPNHYAPWSSFYNETAAGLGLALLAALSARRGLRSRVALPAITIALIAAVPIAQWATGRVGFISDALIACLYLLALSLAIATGELWAAADRHSAAARLSTTLLAGSCVSAVLALIQALDPFSLGIYGMDAYGGMRAYANLGQPNNLATLLALGSVGLVYLYETRRLGPVAAATLLLLLLVGTCLTQSRTALLFGPVFIACLLLAKRRGVRIRTPVGAVAIASFVQLALTLLWPVLQKAMLVAPGATLGERGIESVRVQMWPMLLDAVTLSPWSGYGWLQVGEAELAVADKYPPVGELWLHGHNLFIELIVWCGYPLGIALSGLVIYWFVSRIRAIDTLESMAGMMIVAAFGVHAMLELPHHYAYFLIPVGLWIGQIEHARTASPRISARWMVAPAVLAAALLIGVWKDYPAIEEDFRLVRFQNLNIGNVRSAELAPDAPLLTGLTEFLRFSRTTPTAGMSQAELDRMAAVVKRTPYSGVMLRYAIALSLNGRLPEARTLMVKARHIHGKANYVNLRRDLRDRIAAGQSSLEPLFAAMPQ